MRTTTASLSFRAEDQLAAALQREVERSGRSKSELLNEALRDLTCRFACERDAAIHATHPPTDEVAW